MKTTYYYKSPIGNLKLVCTNEALTYLEFVDNCEDNPKKLSSIILTCKDQLDKYFMGELQEFDIPLAFEIGTEFQRSVWKALSKIPFGEVRSYKDIAEDIAEDIGNPKAVRAVGGANNKNPISIVVPCHRVIGSSGKLVGYASGLENKEWLLTHEKKYRIKND